MTRRDDVPRLPAFVGPPQENRIYHCDALTLLRALPDESVDCVVTDPPYGIGDVVSARRSPHERFSDVANNDRFFDAWLVDTYRVLKSDGAAYIFASWRNFGEWHSSIEAAGFKVRDCLVWDKVVHGLSGLTTHYAPQHEFCVFAVKNKHYINWPRPKNVLRYTRVNPNRLTHPYEKPVTLLTELLRVSTNAGDLVLDIFSGSGATLQAARDSHRRFIGCDLSHEYVTIARKRLEDTDPYRPTTHENGVIQHSLFASTHEDVA